MTTPAPEIVRPILLTGSHGSGRLHRIMHAEVDSQTANLVDLDGRRMPGWRIEIVDASSAWAPTATGSPSIVHVLWTAQRGGVVVRTGNAPDEGAPPEVTMHPGDSLVVPASRNTTIGPGAIALVAHGTSKVAIELAGPSHGLSLFHRYNRRTVCAVVPGLVLERWKLTAPQTLALENDRWHYFGNLVKPVSLVWGNGMLRLGPVQACLVPPGVGNLTLVPDGLAYVLHAYAPDRERDLMVPFREAGFDRSALALVPGLTDGT